MAQRNAAYLSKNPWGCKVGRKASVCTASEPSSLQASDDVDVGPHALDVHPTVPVVRLQTGPYEHAIRLGEAAGHILMGGMAAQNHGQAGHGLFDLPDQSSVDLLI